jgi:glycosyltransferase involved in cell wall biosynthesis
VFQQIVLPIAARQWQAQVVHSPSFIMPLWRGTQRHLLTVHDMTFFSLPAYHIPLRRSLLYQRAAIESIRRADLITVPSCATRQAMCRIVPDIPPDRIRVIAAGVGAEFRIYPPAQIQQAVRRLELPAAYILYVGTIEPRKNLPRLVESYRRLLVQEGIAEHLVLAGRLGWGYKALLQQLNSSVLRDRVHLVGYVPQADLPWVYAGARVFVYPSIEEGFGFPPLEAMACGIPIISSQSSSLAENLQGAAELVLPTDVEALTSAIKRVLQNESLRARLRQQGLARVSKFRWQKTAQQTLDCYNSLAGITA